MISQVSQSNTSYSSLYRASDTAGLLSKLRESYTGGTSSALKGLFGGSNNVDSFQSSLYALQSNIVTQSFSFGKQNTQNLGALKSASSWLTGAARQLGAKTLASSDTDVATVKGLSYSAFSAQTQKVDVQSIATAQVSQTASFQSDEASAFDTGYNSFTLETASGSATIDFSVDSTDTNLDTLNDIATSINSADAGVTAEVVTEKGESRLQITANDTGASNSFVIKPGEGQTAAEKMDARIMKEAGNASFSVNGKAMTSESNTVSLQGGVMQMTLQGAGSTTLSPAVDTSGIVSAAQNFVQSFNTAVSYLSSRQDSAGGSRALSMLTGNGLSRLGAVGIGMDEEGKLTLDKDKLEKAAEENPNSVKNLLSGYGSSVDSVERGADRAMRVPNATYTDFSQMRVQNNLVNLLMPSGSLFDVAL